MTNRWMVTALAGLALLPIDSFAQDAAESEPLPLRVAVSLHRHNHRAPIDASPDGEWVAHTVQTDETVPRGSSARYADSGFPFSEGSARPQALLSRNGGDEAISPGDPGSSSWAPAWSPDGTLVAFYSDEGGEAGLWIWERATGERRRVPGLVVRPAFGFETPRWSPSSDRLLVKVLPRGRSLAEANALWPVPAVEPPTPEVVADEPAVNVRRSAAAEEEPAGASRERRASRDPIDDRMRVFAADLALIELESGRVRRLAEDELIRSYAFSPDGRRVAYAVWTGWHANVQQNLFEIRTVELATNRTVRLAGDLPLGTIGLGNEWSWSPDGGRLAWVAQGHLSIASVGSGQVWTGPDGRPSLPPAPPIWSEGGDRLLAPADGVLWSLDPESGEWRDIARIDGWGIRNVITPSSLSPVAWTSGGRLWVIARERDGRESGIFSVDPDGGEARPALREIRTYGGAFSLAASAGTNEIFFLASGQRELEDLWSLDTGSGEVGRVSRINESLLRYELGTSRLLRWRSAAGGDLAGTLLLPPGYEPGTPLPLVVYVYGGTRGSTAVDRFGLLGPGAAFNMHVLATRGFAVLYPDAPLRTGMSTDDLVDTVLPGVDAAIEAGYADPGRLALMGQSYGAINVVALITRTDRFGAALVTAAVTHPDLFAQYLRNPGYFENGQGDMGGTIWEVPERYRANSPLFDFPRIETPLLIGQGEQDGDLVAAEAIFAGLERLGKVVEYRLYAGEDHVISRPANVIDLWERRLTFLAEHLDLVMGDDGRVTPR